MNNEQSHQINTSTPHLGVDIGRVIIGTASLGGHGDTSFLSGGEDAAMSTPAAPGAVAALGRLTRAFSGRVWLVSKCGPRIQGRSRRWLRHQRFFERTGIHPSHLRFCLKRHQKRGHAEDLGLNFFVDDRVDVLRHLVRAVPHLYLFGHQRGPVSPLPGMKPVIDWAEAERALLEDLAVFRRDRGHEPHSVGAPEEDVAGLGHRARGYR